MIMDRFINYESLNNYWELNYTYIWFITTSHTMNYEKKNERKKVTCFIFGCSSHIIQLY